MSRHRFLVTYDISDPKRLRKVFKAMRDFGDHLQLSVFLCDLNSREFLQLEHRLNRIINHNQDQVLICNLGPALAQELDSIQSLGRDMVVTSSLFVA